MGETQGNDEYAQTHREARIEEKAWINRRITLMYP